MSCILDVSCNFKKVIAFSIEFMTDESSTIDRGRRGFGKIRLSAAFSRMRHPTRSPCINEKKTRGPEIEEVDIDLNALYAFSMGLEEPWRLENSNHYRFLELFLSLTSHQLNLSFVNHTISGLFFSKGFMWLVGQPRNSCDNYL